MVFPAEKSLLLDQLSQGTQENPHQLLGLKPYDKEKNAIYVWRPNEEKVWIWLGEQKILLEKIDRRGLFVGYVPKEIGPFQYQVAYGKDWFSYDPYNFPPFLPVEEQESFLAGKNSRLYRFLGASCKKIQGIEGALFAVWAPHAVSVSVLGDFNNWDLRIHPMRKLKPAGIFELFLPGIEEGQRYQFEIGTQEGFLKRKSDPFAFYSEKRPQVASIVSHLDRFTWTDEAWMEKRKKQKFTHLPMHIYEMHLGSWKRKKGGFYTYRQLAKKLAAYLKKMHYNYVEFLPIMEHPLDESWGYLITGYFAPTSRFGTPEDFRYLVNYLHKQGIGVILDWSPAHFPTDDFALARFDGTPLFEYEDLLKGFHPQWNSLIFDYEKPQVRSFLISSALFWCKEMHIDGIRVDAVTSMLYLDFARKSGEWLPNQEGGNHNLEAIQFLQQLNQTVHEEFPEVLLIAEEASAFVGVTAPVSQGGLGFDMKWNMGWVHDTLRYFSTPAPYRPHNYASLTFKMHYEYTENFLCPLSHDEVAEGKKSLIEKMPGKEEDKMANLRLLYSYMICSTGKKLIFMGAEIGQEREWSCSDSLDWFLLRKKSHRQMKKFFHDMNAFYLKQEPLWQLDYEERGFQWIQAEDKDRVVLSYLRRSTTKVLLIVHHFSEEFRCNYLLPFTKSSWIKEIFSSDLAKYGGSNHRNKKVQISYDNARQQRGIIIDLPPYTTLVFEVFFVQDTNQRGISKAS